MPGALGGAIHLFLDMHRTHSNQWSAVRGGPKLVTLALAGLSVAQVGVVKPTRVLTGGALGSTKTPVTQVNPATGGRLKTQIGTVNGSQHHGGEIGTSPVRVETEQRLKIPPRSSVGRRTLLALNCHVRPHLQKGKMQASHNLKKNLKKVWSGYLQMDGHLQIK